MRTILKAFIRITALVFALQSLKGLSDSFTNFAIFSREDLWPGFIYLGGVLLVIAISVLTLYFTWRKTDKIVTWLVGEVNENEIIINTSNVELFKVIIRAFGVYLLATSIPRLFGLFAYHLLSAPLLRRIPLSEFQQIERIQTWVVQIATALLGIWLLLGAKPIAKALANFWKFGSATNNGEVQKKSSEGDNSREPNQ